jgi:RND family efflux transporter MFP subunit
MISRFSEYPGLLLACLALTAAMLTACGEEPVPEAKEVVRPAKLMTVSLGGSVGTLEYPGNITATQSVELGFEVAGKIVELPVSDGQAVNKGDLLGKLDDSDFVAARDAAEADRKAAQSAYTRAKRIFDQGAGSQAEVDKTLRDIDVAKQQLITAQKALGDSSLKAPFSGWVSRRIADNFQNVQAKQAVVLLQDINSLEIDVNVPERDFSRMKPGLTLKQRNERVRPEIQVSTIPGRQFPARLISFETSADPVTRTYLASFAFDNPDDVNLLPGMTAKVILHLPAEKSEESGNAGLSVPAAAVITDIDGNAYVWRYDAGGSQVSKAVVKIGDMSGSSIRILSGLQNGDRIAVAGAAHLKEGMKVRPLGE